MSRPLSRPGGMSRLSARQPVSRTVRLGPGARGLEWPQPIQNGVRAMKMYYSPASPFVRKCMFLAHHLGLADRIEKLPSAAHPVNRDQSILPVNPLGQVPTLITDDGVVLYDSRVICEYLDEVGQGSFFPSSGAARWRVLTEQALADGILDAALLSRYEGAVRPENFRWADWTAGQMSKITVGLAHFEKSLNTGAQRVDIGTVTLGCALGYLDFRFPDFGWRGNYPNLAAWYESFAALPAMQATKP
jgi:glutathione S-transferase